MSYDIFQIMIKIRFQHHFKTRGSNYLRDKVKYYTGPAICKIMLLEVYEVKEKVNQTYR